MSTKPAISPVNNISPLVPMHVIGDTAEELGFRFEQLNLAQLKKGQLYQGKVVARLDGPELSGGPKRQCPQNGSGQGDACR
jgi:hypothetical protein